MDCRSGKVLHVQFHFVLIWVLFLTPISAYGADRSPTFFATAGGGFYSHESDFVASKDTGYSFDYAVGVFTGADKNLSMQIRSSTIDTTFDLNESKSTLEFQETMFDYYWGPVYLGLGLAQTKTVITRQTETAIDIDAIGTGFAGAVGGAFEFGRSSKFYFDISSVTISSVKEVNKSEFTIGSRLDATMGGSFAITRSLLVGYAAVTYRTLSFALSGTSGNELIMMTHFGLGANLNF
ncbi:MAG: hypothetical protein R3B45_09625 [Bdellovibrionota bacterium]